MSDKIITWNEFGNHIYFYDCWVLVEGNVYNLTDFLVEHPGGDAILIKMSGQDATKEFNDLPHSDFAVSARNARLVGKIQSSQPPEGHLELIASKKKEVHKKDRKKKAIRTGKISKDEVSFHKSEENCWIIIDKKVYDVTEYLEEHPGGVSIIMKHAGGDATEAFNRQMHSEEANKLRDGNYIGELEEGSSMSSMLLMLMGLILLLGGAYCYFFA